MRLRAGALLLALAAYRIAHTLMVVRPGATATPQSRSLVDSEDLNGEAQRAQLIAAVVGDLVRAPGRVPHPVDPQFVDQTGADQCATRLVFDDVGQRAGR